mgnify:CR=1 FL=1
MRQLSRRDFANRVVAAGTGLAAVTAAQATAERILADVWQTSRGPFALTS